MVKTSNDIFLELFGKDILKIDYKYISTALSVFENFIYKPIKERHHRNYHISEKKDYREFLKKFKRYSFSYEFDDFHKKFIFNFTYTWYRDKKLLDLTVSQVNEYIIINIKGYISYFGKGYVSFPTNYPILKYLYNYYPSSWDYKKDYHFNLYYDFDKNDSYAKDYGANAYLEVNGSVLPLKEIIMPKDIEMTLDYHYDKKLKTISKIEYSSYIDNNLYLGINYLADIDSYEASVYSSTYYKNISSLLIDYIKETDQSIDSISMKDIETIEIWAY